MARKNRVIQQNALSSGDNVDIKIKAEQTGSAIVEKMMENHELKAESAGLATEENKYNSSSSC